MTRIAFLGALLLAACHGSSQPAKPEPSKPPSDITCKKTGCSGTVCSTEDVVTTCEYRPEYACYRKATCERQPDGACGWAQTPELTACLANPPQLPNDSPM